nr:unnamed protein product [Digitaria exilis]
MIGDREKHKESIEFKRAAEEEWAARQRQLQIQNEEAIQLKEQYRCVVRKELEDMERRYWDMTSILRALGIPVEGGEPISKHF